MIVGFFVDFFNLIKVEDDFDVLFKKVEFIYGIIYYVGGGCFYSILYVFCFFYYFW